jgi:hypothetical protein
LVRAQIASSETHSDEGETAMSERQSWRSNLYWAIVSAVLGYLVAWQMEAAKNAAYERFLHIHAQHEAAPATQGNAGVCPKAK